MARRLEQLISAHQLISYPSEHRAFDEAYEQALKALDSNNKLDQCYVVQRRSRSTELRFSASDAQMIGSGRKYSFVDIRAVVRRPRVVLDADCTTCGRVSKADSEHSPIMAAKAHVAKTGHIVVLNGTVDISE
jgi:hypothetical protein